MYYVVKFSSWGLGPKCKSILGPQPLLFTPLLVNMQHNLNLV